MVYSNVKKNLKNQTNFPVCIVYFIILRILIKNIIDSQLTKLT